MNTCGATFLFFQGKVPLLTAEALHHLDIFLFVLATFHVILCVFKILLGYQKVWRVCCILHLSRSLSRTDPLRLAFRVAVSVQINQWKKVAGHNVEKVDYDKLLRGNQRPMLACFSNFRCEAVFLSLRIWLRCSYLCRLELQNFDWSDEVVLLE